MQYSIGHKIGHGKYANVYKVEKNHKIYAAKVLPKHRINVPYGKNFTMIHREIDHHKKVSASGSKNIVGFVEVVEDWGNFYLIEDYCPRGDLMNLLESSMPKIEDNVKILRDCLEGLKMCHETGLIFGDLKAENVLIGQDGNFKLCDFGSSRPCNGLYGGSSALAGTPMYMAPEIFDRDAEHGASVDVWALGILAYLICYGAYPYDIECSMSELAQQISSVDICYGGGGRVCGRTEDFIRHCLQKDPKMRMSPREALQHPFLTSASEKPSL